MSRSRDRSHQTIYRLIFDNTWTEGKSRTSCLASSRLISFGVFLIGIELISFPISAKFHSVLNATRYFKYNARGNLATSQNSHVELLVLSFALFFRLLCSFENRRPVGLPNCREAFGSAFGFTFNFTMNSYKSITLINLTNLK